MPNGSHHHANLNLAESARVSLSKLIQLKAHSTNNRQHHFTGDTKTVLAAVLKQTDSNILSLKEWSAAVAAGDQTSDAHVIQTVSDYLKQLNEQIEKAEEALIERLRLRFLHFNVLPSQKYEIA